MVFCPNLLTFHFSWAKCAPSCFPAVMLHICPWFVHVCVCVGEGYIFSGIWQKREGKESVPVCHHNLVVNVFILNIKSTAQWQLFSVCFSFFVERYSTLWQQVKKWKFDFLTFVSFSYIIFSFSMK